MKLVRFIISAGTLALLLSCERTPAVDYKFDTVISQEVLENYLEHSATISQYLTPSSEAAHKADFDFILNTGCKFVGRAAYRWGSEDVLNDPDYWADIKKYIDEMHEADPDVIFQACAFESIYKEGIEQVKIPAWVFEAYDLPVEDRCFSYDDMLFPEGFGVDLWSPGSSVPDIRQRETQLWFFFLIGSYINAGCEAIHLGQTYLIGYYDKDNWECFSEFLSKVRSYCNEKARRHLVLFDAHGFGRGMMVGDYSLLDYNAFPIRVKADPSENLKGVLEVGYTDAIFQKTVGCRTPSGWTCERLPYLVEIDNYGVSDHPGEYMNPSNWNYPDIWGYDEITWFYMLGAERRQEWLRYAFNFVHENDSVGHLEMPCTRGISPGNGQRGLEVHGCAPTDEVPGGMDIENTIKELWNGN